MPDEPSLTGAAVVLLTSAARSMISDLVARSSLPAEAGLRIARPPHRVGLTTVLAEQPEAGDVVVTGAGIRLYLDGVAVERLRGQRLDARRNEQGAAFFVRP